MADPIGALTFQQLVEKAGETLDSGVDRYVAWADGTATGGPDPLQPGHYPIPGDNSSLKPSPAKMAADVAVFGVGARRYPFGLGPNPIQSWLFDLQRQNTPTANGLGNYIWPNITRAPQGGASVRIGGVRYMMIALRDQAGEDFDEDDETVGSEFQRLCLFPIDGAQGPRPMVARSDVISTGHQGGGIQKVSDAEIYLWRSGPGTAPTNGKGLSRVRWRDGVSTIGVTTQSDVTVYKVWGDRYSGHPQAEWVGSNATASNTYVAKLGRNFGNSSRGDSDRQVWVYRIADLVAKGNSGVVDCTDVQPVAHFLLERTPDPDTDAGQDCLITDDGWFIYLSGNIAWNLRTTLQAYNFLTGEKIIVDQVDGSRGDYGRTKLMNGGADGHMTDYEPEALAFYDPDDPSQGVMIAWQEKWKTPGAIVSHRNLNFATYVSNGGGYVPGGGAKGQRTWAPTGRAATHGEWQSGGSYPAPGATLLFRAPVYRVGLPLGLAGEAPLSRGIAHVKSGATIHLPVNNFDMTHAEGTLFKVGSYNQHSDTYRNTFNWELGVFRHYDDTAAGWYGAQAGSPDARWGNIRVGIKYSAANALTDHWIAMETDGNNVANPSILKLSDAADPNTPSSVRVNLGGQTRHVMDATGRMLMGYAEIGSGGPQIKTGNGQPSTTAGTETGDLPIRSIWIQLNGNDIDGQIWYRAKQTRWVPLYAPCDITANDHANFPVGTFLSVAHLGTAPSRTSNVTVYLAAGNTNSYTQQTGGSQVFGTWKARGAISTTHFLAERIA